MSLHEISDAELVEYLWSIGKPDSVYWESKRMRKAGQCFTRVDPMNWRFAAKTPLGWLFCTYHLSRCKNCSEAARHGEIDVGEVCLACGAIDPHFGEPT